MPRKSQSNKNLEKLISTSKFQDREPLSAEEAIRTFKLHHISVRHAWDGVVTAFLTQPNFRIHAVLFLAANFLAFIFEITIVEYISIMVMSALVLVCEMVNTAVEALADEVAQGEYRRLVGVAKDVAAGAVLISAVFAIVIGIVIFVPKFLNLL